MIENQGAVVFKSNYSLMQSMITIDKMLAFALEQQLTHLVIADENVLFGAVEFYHKAVAQELTPHIGMQLKLVDMDVLLIAKDNVGYQSLMKLSSRINGYDFVFTTDLDVLQALKHVIIIVSHLEPDTLIQIKKEASNTIYLNQNTYHNQHIDEYSVIDAEICNVLTQADIGTLEVLQAIAHNESVVQSGNMITTTMYRQQSLLQLHDLTNPTVIMDFSRYHLPYYPLEQNEKEQLLFNLCKKGLQKRYGQQLQAAYYDRLTYELEIIIQMGFADYFLIIWDVMRFAKKADIIIGPGRGSAVGSITAYVLGITKIDPMKYNLLFERFLNPSRHSLPDIDIDVEDGRRQEIIQYLREKYGYQHVAQIITFGTFGAKSAVRDVAKAYNLEADKIQQLSKYVTNSMVSIAENIEMNDKLQQVLQNQPTIRKVFEVAQQIEGFPRHASTHAAGIILTNKPIEHYIATIEQTNQILTTQATMGECERIGLLKIDFLGLRNLTIMRDVVEQIAPAASVVDFLDHQIPENDTAAFALLTSGETTGIFQFESAGIRRVLQQFKINQFIDIATVLSLYRPGPMQFIDEYIQRKNQQKPFVLAIEQTRDILQDTYGIMVYQEQIMQIAQVIGKMSLAEADDFRRAIAKKNKSLLETQRTKFLQGAIDQRIDSDAAQQLFDEILAFANYGFNKSHAIAYADIAYKMAYLKQSNPAIFLTGLLNSVLHNEKKSFAYLQEAMRFGIKILPPDINLSAEKYTVEEQNIRIGFAAIKSLGKVTVNHILEQRANGLYESLNDFMSRTDRKMITKTILEQLINAYAFARFSKNQRALEQFVEIHEVGRKFQSSIMTLQHEIPNDVDDYTLEERREKEQLAYGFSLFAHPLLAYPKNNISLTEPDKKYFDCIVYIEKVKQIQTKKGDAMAFATVSDMQEKVEVVIFPRAFTNYSLFLQEKKIVKLSLNIQENQDGTITRSVSKIQLL